MKKFLALIFTLAFLASSLAMTTFAYTGVSLDVPKATKAPTIDGVMDPEEWAGALTIDMSMSKLLVNAGTDVKMGDSKSYFMWDDTNLYFLADVKDLTAPDTAPAMGAALNVGDGFQLGIFSTEKGAAGQGGTHLFVTAHPKTLEGTPDMYEHFNIIGQLTGTLGAKIASKMVDNSYVVECSVPWTIFAQIYTNGFAAEIKGVTGQQMLVSNVIMEMNGAEQGLLTNTGWFTPDEIDTYTLSDVAAGPAPVVETVVEDTAVDASANPETSDMAMFPVVALLVISAVVFVAVKKKNA